MGIIERLFQPAVSRRRFLQATAATGATSALIGGHTLRETQAQATPSARATTTITKNVCHQCPARCGIDVYTTDGRIHAIYGNPDHPIANGKLCPKGPLGVYIPYDPDRWKGPMKRTNPRKGRSEDPKFVPISWDEALQTVADRLKGLRERGESHRFAMLSGRGWGTTDIGLMGQFGALYGTPNGNIGHSSMCSDGSMKARFFTDGNDSYNAHDYRNCNYLLMFGCGFLEAFRPYNYNMQMWGIMRSKSPKTRVTAVDIHMNTTLAASDRALLIKPGTDGAMALAIAQVLLAEGLWDKSFVGDFTDGVNRFVPGETVDAALFQEKWTHGLIEWWNLELKDRSPEWAATVTDIPAETIRTVAREFGTTRPAMAIFERGAHAHTNGVFNAMAIHALNGLVGAVFAKGGMMYQMGPSYGSLPANYADYRDDYAQNGPWRQQPRIDLQGHRDGYLLARNMQQEVGPNSLKGNPYKLDTLLFYQNNAIWTAPNGQVWEEALKEVFVIDTSPFPSESGHFADLILPDHTYLERYQDCGPMPLEGYPHAHLRVPAIKPIHDTKYFGDVLIEIGKRMGGRMAEYFQVLDNTENMLRHMARGFANNPGDNGVDGWEAWVEKGIWYKKPYLWQLRDGTFYEWDGKDYARVMDAEQVKARLLRTPSGKFEFRSGRLEQHADWIAGVTGRDPARLMFPIWEEPVHPGGGDLYLSTPKVALHAEGRGSNLPMVIANLQPVHGGRGEAFVEIHPETAAARGIRDLDRVRISSEVGSIEARCRVFAGTRPDTIVLPMEYGHWASGRWSKAVPTGHSGDCTVNRSDRVTGQCMYYSTKVTIEKA